MIQKIADNIYSPLGGTTDSNYAAVCQGHSMLRTYDGSALNLPEPFTASLFDWSLVEPVDDCTPFERIAIASIDRALAKADIDVRSEGLLFILSTTKGNVGLLDSRQASSAAAAADRVPLGAAAQRIASHFGFRRQPLVVSNACISGLSAQLTAMRLLEAGYCDTAIVCGADVQTRFVVSGFGALKALSPVECRPFDIERCGLNLGEAAATIIYRASRDVVKEDGWVCVRGAVRNDAHHVSSPSPKGEGCYRAIRAAMGGIEADRLAFVNAHGTATLFNDEMEAVALSRAGLLGVPVNSLKGYYGHTMGAAGVLETILSMRAIDCGCIPGTRGFLESGVSQPVLVSADNRPTTKRAFLKLLSGFGGGNAAMVFEKIEALKDGRIEEETMGTDDAVGR